MFPCVELRLLLFRHVSCLTNLREKERLVKQATCRKSNIIMHMQAKNMIIYAEAKMRDAIGAPFSPINEQSTTE